MGDTTRHFDRLRRTIWWYSAALGVTALLLGLIVIVGWCMGNRTLVQVLPGFAPMQFNTALGFVLCGVALLSLAFGQDRWAAILGALIAMIGMLTLLEYVGDVDLGIDELLMKHDITTGTSHPGRMAPNTAVCFTLTGLWVVIPVFHFLPSHRAFVRVVLASFTLGLAVVALAGYFPLSAVT
jgi:hypothetical protein